MTDAAGSVAGSLRSSHAATRSLHQGGEHPAWPIAVRLRGVGQPERLGRGPTLLDQ